MPKKGWAVLSCLILFACAAFWYRGNDGYEFEEEACTGSYRMTAAADVGKRDRMQETGGSDTVQVQINGMPDVDASGGRCNLMAGNPVENDKDLLVMVTLDHSGEIIYQSPVLKPGERLAYVTLEFVPEPGEYSATAEFLILSPETGEQLGAVDAGILLTVS